MNTVIIAIPLLAAALSLSAQRIDVPERGVDLPMGNFGGRPTVEVRLNGKGPFGFILDLGADTTVIDAGLATELALPASKEQIPTEPGPTVKIASLNVGDASLREAVVVTAPLSRMFGAAEAPRGVLSAAAFPGYLLTLDYPGKRILIRKGALPPADSRTSWDFTAEQVLPSAIVKVSGVEVRVHVDSGSPGSVTLPTKYMKEIKLASEPVQQGRMQTPGGVFPVWSAKIDAPVELGPFKLDVTNVQFSDVNPIPGPPVGNLGFQVLKRFRITFDSKNRRIAFAE